MIMNLTILFSLFISLPIFIKHILLTEPTPKTEMGQAEYWVCPALKQEINTSTSKEKDIHFDINKHNEKNKRRH